MPGQHEPASNNDNNEPNLNQPDPIFSVTECHEMLNVHLARLGEIAIEGEISDIKESSGKWIYITLSDASSTIKLFGTQWDIRNWKDLETGMKVHAYGVARTYARYGTLSITVSKIVPAGAGALKVALERLQKRLTQEGLFDPSRKRPLPLFPRRIGLITAKGSQAYNDFVKVLQHRMGGIHIYFFPVLVQGEHAPAAICKAVQYANTRHADLDALVICRGGGSLEDLQAFNDESVVRAVFASTIPIISGVGHEGDTTLIDHVADVRASTPSNAAELLVKEREHVIQSIDMFIQRMQRVFTSELAEKKRVIDVGLTRIEHTLTNHVTHMQQGVKDFYSSVNTYQRSCQRAIDKQQTLERILTNIDYHTILKRGFSITQTSGGTLIRSVDDVSENDELIAAVTDGSIY